MASIRIKYRKSKVKNKKGSCFIQLIHKRKMTTLATGMRLNDWEWDTLRGCVSFKKATSKRAKELLSIQERLDKIIGDLEAIEMELEDNHLDYTVEILVERYKNHGSYDSFFTLMERRILLMEEAGQNRTASNYRETLNMFKRFRDGHDLYPGNLTSLLVEEFQGYLQKRGNSLNTISYYMRILKAFYNYGIKKNWIKDNKYPFQGVFTGMEKTAKRAVDNKVVQDLIDLDLRNKPTLDLAKDMFLFSVYTRGMSFIDVAYLTKENVRGNILVYKRHKTNQRIEITLPDCAMRVIRKYADLMSGSVYLFPLLRHPRRGKDTAYVTVLHLHNERLRKISEMLGLKINLTSYTARHTWATLAKRNGVETYVISEAMGHTSETTTRIYLASLNNAVLDNANEVVINSMLNFHENQSDD